MRSPEQVYEEYLVLSAQNGDVRAFDLLVKHAQPLLLRHARRLSGRSEVAQDVMQEAWLAIARSLNRLGDPARFRAWAMRIIARKCADAFHRDQRRRETEATAGEAARKQSAPSDDRGTDLREALSHLPGEEHVVLSLFYLERMSVMEIAKALDIPTGTVKSRLHRARGHLKAIVERIMT